MGNPHFVTCRCSIVLACLIVGQSPALAQAPQVLNKEPLPAAPSFPVVEPVPVPETVGATLLAGVGFFMLFRRRRYS